MVVVQVEVGEIVNLALCSRNAAVCMHATELPSVAAVAEYENWTIWGLRLARVL